MQNKRSLFVCLLVILTLCATLAVAAEGSSLQIIVGVDESTPAVVYEGDTFVVNVGLANNNTGIDVLQFAVEYDADNLEYVSYTSGDVFGENIKVETRGENQVVCIYIGTDAQLEEGTIVSYTFRAKKDIDPRASFKIEHDSIGGIIGGEEGGSDVVIGGVIPGGADVPVQGNPPVDDDGNIAIHTHVYNKTEIAATCENDQYDRYQCDCGYYYDDVYEDTATGHAYGAWVSNGDNTHTKTCPNANCETPSVTEACAGGTATCEDKAVCEACNAEHGEALGHTPGSAATCTTAQTCTVCNKELKPAHGHTEEVIPAVDPTYSKEGSTEGEKCSVCDAIIVAPEIIPVKSLTWLWILISAVVVVGAGAGVAVYFFVFKKKVK